MGTLYHYIVTICVCTPAAATQALYNKTLESHFLASVLTEGRLGIPLHAAVHMQHEQSCPLRAGSEITEIQSWRRL